MSGNKNLLILGERQYGQTAKEIAEETGEFENIVTLDETPNNENYKNKITEFLFAFVALSASTERLKLTRILEECGYKIATLISPKAYVSRKAKVGKGVMVEPFAVINSEAIISDCCYIRANAVIDYGRKIGEGSTICCGATVVDNTYVQPQTEVKHGQTFYGDKLAKRTPEGNNYCFEDGM